MFKVKVITIKRFISAATVATSQVLKSPTHVAATGDGPGTDEPAAAEPECTAPYVTLLRLRRAKILGAWLPSLLGRIWTLEGNSDRQTLG